MLGKNTFAQEVGASIFASMEIRLEAEDFWFQPDYIEAKIDDDHDIESAYHWLSNNDKYHSMHGIDLYNLIDEAYAAYMAHMIAQGERENESKIARIVWRIRYVVATVLTRAADRIMA